MRRGGGQFEFIHVIAMVDRDYATPPMARESAMKKIFFLCCGLFLTSENSL